MAIPLHPAGIPAYLKDMPDTTNLSSKDTAKIFGYASGESLNHAVMTEAFPKCDFAARTVKGSPRHFWSLRTIRAEWKKRYEQ